ncbi:methyltransferase family protein [Maribellus comscasis]|nr:isoprenylcysteine carboxylmethyltransferase family protein [Maribellus comscasis]
MNGYFVKFGNWIFRYRNIIFPLFYAALFVPSMQIFQNSTGLLLGAFIIALGVAVRCITIGLEYIIRGGRHGKIHANNLVTGGIYSICRNPMYVGNILLILGFGVFANSLLFLLLFFPLFLIIYRAIIKAEEAFLYEKFGQEYLDYTSKVKSLIPDLRKIKSAFKGYTFNWKRVLLREYNSLYLYISGIELLMFYNKVIEFSMLVILFVITTVLYVLMKMLKKTRFSDYAKNTEK